MSDDCTRGHHDEWMAFGTSRYCQLCGHVDLHPDAIAAATKIISEDQRQPSYFVYGDLTRKFVQALRDGNEELRTKTWTALELIRELYPESAARWEADYTPKDGAMSPSPVTDDTKS